MHHINSIGLWITESQDKIINSKMIQKLKIFRVRKENTNFKFVFKLNMASLLIRLIFTTTVNFSHKKKLVTSLQWDYLLFHTWINLQSLHHTIWCTGTCKMYYKYRINKLKCGNNECEWLVPPCLLSFVSRIKALTCGLDCFSLPSSINWYLWGQWNIWIWKPQINSTWYSMKFVIC